MRTTVTLNNGAEGIRATARPRVTDPAHAGSSPIPSGIPAAIELLYDYMIIRLCDNMIV